MLNSSDKKLLLLRSIKGQCVKLEVFAGLMAI